MTDQYVEIINQLGLQSTKEAGLEHLEVERIEKGDQSVFYQPKWIMKRRRLIAPCSTFWWI